uniref:Uncharacterized protein n=1 Tax=Rhizobium rhizogenes TaxID=359 RepID=A0A7S4ZUU6_RHIRH|nr:hypothetical protein pC5.8b_456 [Rhizobium rhizogenes]
MPSYAPPSIMIEEHQRHNCPALRQRPQISPFYGEILKFSLH